MDKSWEVTPAVGLQPERIVREGGHEFYLLMRTCYSLVLREFAVLRPQAEEFQKSFYSYMSDSSLSLRYGSKWRHSDNPLL